MKNVIKAIGLAGLTALTSGCNKEQETQIIRNPALENIFNDRTLAVYENYNHGISRPDAFVYAKELKFCYHVGKPTYPAAGRVEFPYLEMQGKGKATLHLRYNHGLVVSELPFKQ